LAQLYGGEKMFNKFKDTLLTKEVTVPVTKSMIQRVIPDVDGVYDTQINIDEVLIITGIYKLEKLLIKKDIPFEINLKPKYSDGRTLFFDITLLKPYNIEIVKKYALNNKYMTYSKDLLSIDLNAVDVIKKVPFGKIKRFVVVQDKMLVTLGL
jgi:hypothetical protein